jgi:hypothetical protein
MNCKKEIKTNSFVHIALLFTIIASTCNTNSNSGRSSESYQMSARDTAIISFKEYEHDFGKLAEGEKIACIFIFENTGKGRLVISSATTSCGCTVSKYDNKPVPPGGTGNIEVVFDSSGRNGKQTKTITVMSNASKPIVLLKITGEVITSTNN